MKRLFEYCQMNLEIIANISQTMVGGAEDQQ